MTPTPIKKMKSYCSGCLNDTNHEVLFKHNISGASSEYDDQFSSSYHVLSCAGCETVSYRTEYDDTTMLTHDEDGSLMVDTQITILPVSIKYHKELVDTYYLPKGIKTVYEESLKCIANDCKLMAVTAFRAIIEAVCENKAITGKDLKVKITNLASAGLISKEDSKRLHAIRFLGNDAVHELSTPTKEQLDLVLQIIEHLLTSSFILPKLTEEILESMIDTYDKFMKVLDKKVKETYFSDERTLKTILGKATRRIEDADLATYELTLQVDIGSSKCASLSDCGLKPIGGGKTARFYKLTRTS